MIPFLKSEKIIIKMRPNLNGNSLKSLKPFQNENSRNIQKSKLFSSKIPKQTTHNKHPNLAKTTKAAKMAGIESEKSKNEEKKGSKIQKMLLERKPKTKASSPPSSEEEKKKKKKAESEGIKSINAHIIAHKKNGRNQSMNNSYPAILPQFNTCNPHNSLFLNPNKNTHTHTHSHTNSNTQNNLNLNLNHIHNNMHNNNINANEEKSNTITVFFFKSFLLFLIKVAVRIRPHNQRELNYSQRKCVCVNNQNVCVLVSCFLFLIECYY